MRRMFFRMGKIIAGTLLMAMAVNFVFEPINMVTGGVSGLSILIKEVTRPYYTGGFPVWLSNLIINVPIFLWGYFVRGKSYLGYTLFANLCFSAFLWALPITAIQEKDYFLAALYGAALTGSGLGLIFATGYSTGGTDLLGSILHRYFRNISVATFLFVLDAIVITLGAVTFGLTITGYAIIAVFLSSKIMDTILSGLKVGKQVWIISENYQDISNEIMRRLERGVTCVQAKGMYSHDTKNVLLCVVGKREIVSVIKIVRKYDASAFLIVQDAKEVMGEGFSEIE